MDEHETTNLANGGRLDLGHYSTREELQRERVAGRNPDAFVLNQVALSENQETISSVAKDLMATSFQIPLDAKLAIELDGLEGGFFSIRPLMFTEYFCIVKDGKIFAFQWSEKIKMILDQAGILPIMDSVNAILMSQGLKRHDTKDRRTPVLSANLEERILKDIEIDKMHGDNVVDAETNAYRARSRARLGDACIGHAWLRENLPGLFAGLSGMPPAEEKRSRNFFH